MFKVSVEKYVGDWVNKIVEGIIDTSRRRMVFKDRSLIKVMTDCASRDVLEVLWSRGSDAVPGVLAIVHTLW